MAYKFNPFHKRLDFYGAIPTGTSDPSGASEGDLFINTTDDGMKVYYGGTWQTLHTLTAAIPSFLLLEDTFSFLLEDGTSKFRLES